MVPPPPPPCGASLECHATSPRRRPRPNPSCAQARAKLLGWYDRVHRVLPWRRNPHSLLGEAGGGATAAGGGAAAEAAPQGRQLRFPATCRRALPILDTVTGWNLAPEGGLRLQDAQGKTVIAFRDGTPERGFTGSGSDGKAYALASKNHPRAARRPVASPAELAATAAQRPTLVDPARAPAPDTLPGRYAVMRQPDREACRIVLSPAATGAPAAGPAAFEGLCRDTGLAIFDPAGWRYLAGRLTLVARKGHGVELVFENGQWRKDPAVGAPLLLRRLAP